MNMTRLLWSAVIMVLLLSGCGWDGTATRKNVFTPLTSITISADYSTVAPGTTAKLTVIGDFSGQFTEDVTDRVTWSSDTPGVAAFSSTTVPNRVKGAAAGSAILTATVGIISTTYPITVSSTTISTVTITPAAPSVATGVSQQFAASGTFSDNTTQDITFDSVWYSNATGTATVSDAESSKGLATALAIGTATISANFGSVTGTTQMTVTDPVLQTIALSAGSSTLLTLSSTNITALGTYSNHTTKDITSMASWSSANSSYVTVSGGTATVLKPGTTSITASLDGVSASVDLTATGGTLTSITLNPGTTSLVKGVTRTITATGNFSNGSSRDITQAVTWTSANSALVTVTPATAVTGNLAWLNPVAVTAGTTLKASATSAYAVDSATLNITVAAPTLSSIAMSTTSMALTTGTSSPLSVIATFSDGTSQDVSALDSCVWTSNNTAIATVATAGGGTERVTGVAAGTAFVSATYGGKTVPTRTTVTVTTRTLQSLAVSGSASIGVGNQVSYSATATYYDGTTIDVTTDTDWTLSSSSVATLPDSVNQPGQIVGVTAGSTDLTAVFGTKTAPTKTITVTGP